ncbi:MAG TPA: cytochrome c oxidase subunit II [Solirubrobacter sp.]|nr:cytochrome c oxidase subunit II [Solirubrobacter sp.]
MRNVYDGLSALYLAIAIAVFVVVAIALIWAVTTRGPEREEHRRFELVYAAVLAAIAAVLLVFTFRATDRENARAAGRVDVIRVVAGKWDWRFEHADGRVETDVLTVRAGVPVEFRATSVDVVHGFWIPALKFQRQVIPGRVTTFRLTFPHAGWVTSGACSFFCGLEHSRMRFSVEVTA